MEYKLVQLPNGTQSIHSLQYGETMHPAIGPAAEAEALYVDQLKLRERLLNHKGEFVVWDVGTGGAANVLTFFRCTKDIQSNVSVIGFDNTIEPLRFAFENADQLGYVAPYREQVGALLSGKEEITFQNDVQFVRWGLMVCDFPKALKKIKPGVVPAPHAILFDPFSPKKNPAMWTAPVFADLFRLLNPARPCSLATYSRSTMVRAALLLAGFFVGAGKPTGQKETTIAANSLDLLDNSLNRTWLEKAQRSDSAEPLWESTYRQAKLSAETLNKLQAHPQFATV